jgi:galactokinase/mevalonate kinase-like predicted kinase
VPVLNTTPFKEHAQDGRGIKRPPEGLRSVSSLMVARIRALCAFKEHAQDGRGIKRPAEGLRSVSSLMVARIRALCAFKELVPRSFGINGLRGWFFFDRYKL